MVGLVANAATLATRLRLVHRQVGLPQQLLRDSIPSPLYAMPMLAPNGTCWPGPGHAGTHRRQQAVTQGFDRGFVTSSSRIANSSPPSRATVSLARTHAARAGGRARAAPRRRSVPESVVDRLEAVEVAEQQGDAGPPASGELPGAWRQPVEQDAAVGQLGQRVVAGEVHHSRPSSLSRANRLRRHRGEGLERLLVGGDRRASPVGGRGHESSARSRPRRTSVPISPRPGGSGPQRHALSRTSAGRRRGARRPSSSWPWTVWAAHRGTNSTLRRRAFSRPRVRARVATSRVTIGTDEKTEHPPRGRPVDDRGQVAQGVEGHEAGDGEQRSGLQQLRPHRCVRGRWRRRPQTGR